MAFLRKLNDRRNSRQRDVAVTEAEANQIHPILYVYDMKRIAPSRRGAFNLTVEPDADWPVEKRTTLLSDFIFPFIDSQNDAYLVVLVDDESRDAVASAVGSRQRVTVEESVTAELRNLAARTDGSMLAVVYLEEGTVPAASVPARVRSFMILDHIGYQVMMPMGASAELAEGGIARVRSIFDVEAPPLRTVFYDGNGEFPGSSGVTYRSTWLWNSLFPVLVDSTQPAFFLIRGLHSRVSISPSVVEQPLSQAQQEIEWLNPIADGEAYVASHFPQVASRFQSIKASDRRVRISSDRTYCAFEPPLKGIVEFSLDLDLGEEYKPKNALVSLELTGLNGAEVSGHGIATSGIPDVGYFFYILSNQSGRVRYSHRLEIPEGATCSGMRVKPFANAAQKVRFCDVAVAEQ